MPDLTSTMIGGSRAGKSKSPRSRRARRTSGGGPSASQKRERRVRDGALASRPKRNPSGVRLGMSNKKTQTMQDRVPVPGNYPTGDAAGVAGRDSGVNLNQLSPQSDRVAFLQGRSQLPETLPGNENPTFDDRVGAMAQQLGLRPGTAGKYQPGAVMPGGRTRAYETPSGGVGLIGGAASQRAMAKRVGDRSPAEVMAAASQGKLDAGPTDEQRQRAALGLSATPERARRLSARRLASEQGVPEGVGSLSEIMGLSGGELAGVHSDLVESAQQQRQQQDVMADATRRASLSRRHGTPMPQWAKDALTGGGGRGADEAGAVDFTDQIPPASEDQTTADRVGQIFEAVMSSPQYRNHPEAARQRLAELGVTQDMLRRYASSQETGWVGKLINTIGESVTDPQEWWRNFTGLESESHRRQREARRRRMESLEKILGEPVDETTHWDVRLWE